MNENKRIAQTWIIAGFALVALGVIFNFGLFISNNYLGEGNVRADLQLFAVPISSIAALWAWWFLGKIAASESAYAPLFKKAFLGLTIQFACLTFTYVNLLWMRPSLDKYTTSIWLQTLGVRGHEKVSAGGQLRSPLVAMKSPRWWPREVLTPY